MGVTKTTHFTEHQNQLANIAKALGHPARIAIIEHLVKVNQCICGDIVEELPLAQPTVSQHLKELKNAGIIKGNVEGTAVCYCIDKNTWQLIRQKFNDLFDALDRNCC
jgi:DNA-binding transcriptional ArsR family regulator